MEQINLTSALPGNELFQIAHTRGKTVMKEAVPLPDEPVDPAGLKKVSHRSGMGNQSMSNL